MKITIDFENGMQLTLKPENLQLADNNGIGTALVTRTDKAVIPIVFFNLAVATPTEMAAREAAAKVSAENIDSTTAPQ